MDELDIEDQARLEFTINTRRRIIRELYPDDGKIPHDRADKELLISALDGMDRTVLGRSKLKLDAANSKQQEQTSKLISEILLSVTSKPTSPPRNSAPALPNTVPEPKLVPGEADIGMIDLNYDDFITG